jgi:hypothetical protein
MDKGNKDQHRRSLPGVGRVSETSKWGQAKAYERYGKPQYLSGAPSPKDQSQPQFKETDGQGPGYSGNAKSYRTSTKGNR